MGERDNQRSDQMSRLIEDIDGIVDGKGKRALLLFREIEEEKAVRDQLSALGYQIHRIRNAYASLDALRTRTYDIVVSDFDVWNGNAAVLFSRIRGSRRPMPVIFVGGVESENPARLAGAAAFLTRPLAPKAIVQVVSSVLREIETESESESNCETPRDVSEPVSRHVPDHVAEVISSSSDGEGLDLELVDDALDLEESLESVTSIPESSVPQSMENPVSAENPVAGQRAKRSKAASSSGPPPLPVEVARDASADVSSDVSFDVALSAWWRFFFETRRALRGVEGVDERLKILLNRMKECLEPGALGIVQPDSGGLRLHLDEVTATLDRSPSEARRLGDMVADALCPRAKSMFPLSIQVASPGARWHLLSDLSAVFLEQHPEMSEELHLLLAETLSASPGE